MFYSLKAPYRKSAVFLMNDASVKALRKLKDSNGQYLWQPSLTVATPDTLMGRPVILRLIIGKGTELDDSGGVQTARKAKELLDKLAEYKPLAKIEELEECNYNMIDNVLNNEKPKEEKQTGRISIKEKLAEKKAVIGQRDKSEKEAPEKGTDKKSGREI